MNWKYRYPLLRTDQKGIVICLSGWRYYDGYYRGSRYGTSLPGTIYYTTQAQGALKKCWKGFIIANSKRDMKNMRYYAQGVRKKHEKVKNLSQQ